MELFIVTAIAYVIYALYFLVTYIITLAHREERCRNSFSERIMVFSEIVYTIVGPIVGFARFDDYGSSIPFEKQYVLSIIILVIVSSTSYWIARCTSRSENPVLRIIVSIGLLQGIVLCLVSTIHFISIIPLGLVFPIMGFELLSPFFALLLLSRKFYFYNKLQIKFEDALPYKSEFGFVPLMFKIYSAPFFYRILIYCGLLILVIAAQAFIAYGFGQDIDAIIKAFRHSRGFIFSM